MAYPELGDAKLIVVGGLIGLTRCSDCGNHGQPNAQYQVVFYATPDILEGAVAAVQDIRGKLMGTAFLPDSLLAPNAFYKSVLGVN